MSQPEADPFTLLSTQLDPYEPALHHIYKTVAAFNSKLAQGDLSIDIENVEKIADEFDSMLPFYEKEVQISGSFYIGDVTEDGTVILTGTDSMEDLVAEPALCHGFFLYQHDNAAQLGFLFACAPDESEEEIRLAWAPIDQCLVEPQQTPSKQMEQYMPAAKAIIDTAIGDIYNDANAVLALQNVAIQHEDDCAISRDEQRSLMSTYINGQVPRTKHEPHLLTWEGIYFQSNSEKEFDLTKASFLDQPEERFAWPHQFTFIPELFVENGELNQVETRSIPTLIAKVMRPIIKGRPISIHDLPLVAVPISKNVTIIAKED